MWVDRLFTLNMCFPIFCLIVKNFTFIPALFQCSENSLHQQDRRCKNQSSWTHKFKIVKGYSWDSEPVSLNPKAFLEAWSHRRRICTEKAKVNAAASGTELLQFLTVLAMLHQGNFMNIGWFAPGWVGRIGCKAAYSSTQPLSSLLYINSSSVLAAFQPTPSLCAWYPYCSSARGW